MSVKLHLSHDDKSIQFLNKEFGIVGFTDYTPEIWEELCKANWYVDERKLGKEEKNYIYTGSSRFGSFRKLHQIVMMYWYGKEAVQAAYERDYIIEHHNNDEFDNYISNLSFATNDQNLSKAHSFDKTQPKLLRKAAVNFFKDFSTQQYQITIKFNDNYFLNANCNIKCNNSR